MSQRYPLVQLLSTNGDGTGTTEMIGDYTTPDEFYIANSSDPNVDYTVVRLLFYIEDTGVFDADKFGALAELSNGIVVKWEQSDGTDIVNLTPDPITSNSHFGKYAYDVQVQSWGTVDEFLVARWTFGRFVPGAAGTPDGLCLEGDTKIVITCNDNHTGLNEFTCVAQGWQTRSR